ncbi:MAG: type 1 glutamine amidotransferase [Methanobacteriaceae archaeon]
MNTDKMELNIVNMYPDILNLYGDIGNFICIKKRCNWMGIDVIEKNFTLGSEINFENTDMILIGGGSDRGQGIVLNHLQNYRNELSEFIDDSKVLLAICGSYQILGEYYQEPSGEKYKCLEIFDIQTKSKDDRIIGDIVIENNLGLEPKTVIGFENHGGRTYHNYTPFGNVLYGYGNNDQDKNNESDNESVNSAQKGEGMIYKNFIGSYLHGPMLPKNPHIADYMIFEALKTKYNLSDNDLNELHSNNSINTIDNTIELKAHKAMKNRLL